MWIAGELTMALSLSPRHSGYLWVANLVVLAATLAASFLVDANGRILILAEKASTIVATLLFSSGILCSVVIAMGDGKRRIYAIICVFVYILLLWPAFAP
jgi:hypothetical protein